MKRMEERSAANLGGTESDVEDDDFGEGYEVEQLLMEVRGEDLQPTPPVLQVTRRQKILAGETVLIPKRCQEKDCASCQMSNCGEAGVQHSCPCCKEPGKQALCIRKGRCKSWTEAQYRQFEEAREVLQALRESSDPFQGLAMGAGCTNPDATGQSHKYQAKEANTGTSLSKNTAKTREDEMREEGSKEEESDEQVVQIMIPRRETGTIPKVPKLKTPGTALSLAARPFVQREESTLCYSLKLDLNQLSYQFDPSEYRMTTKEGRLMVTALHQNEESQGGNTPTRSGQAGQSYSQEFELPPNIDPASATCTITKDNIAEVEFRYTKPVTMPESQKSAFFPKATVEKTSKTESRKDQEEKKEKEGVEEVKLMEGMSLQRSIQEGEREIARQVEAQRRKYLEVMKMQKELKENHEKLQRISEGLEEGLHQSERALGAQAISREEMEYSPRGEEEEWNHFRGRWAKANQEWKGYGMPRFPGKGVHWRELAREEASFYSAADSPEMPTPVRAPIANAEKGGDREVARRKILTAATFNPDRVSKPWDRGGSMQSPTKAFRGTETRDNPTWKPSILKTNVDPFQRYTSLLHTPVNNPVPREGVEAHQRQDTLEEDWEPPGERKENTNTPAATSTPIKSKKMYVPEVERDEELEEQKKEKRKTVTEQDQLAQVLTLLTDKLMKAPNASQEKASTLKLPTITLPKCKKDGSDITSARQWYTFKYNLFTAMATHKLDPKILLMHYSTDTRLLSNSIQDTFQTSDTLQGALEAVDSRYPPVSSLHSELQKELLSFPPMDTNSEKAKILRISKVLTSLEDFLKFFKNEATLDISREKILVILHNLAGDAASKQELVKEVAEMDRKRAAGQLYADSLKQFLLRQRLMYVDLNAALTLVGNHGGKHRSAAYKSGGEGDKWKDKDSPKKEACPLCSGLGHKAWGCSKELPKLKEGTRPIPSQLCRACLDIRKTGHPQNCSIGRTKQNGLFYLYDNKCPKCSIHVRICPCDIKAKKKIDPNQNPTPIKKSSAALRTIFLPQEHNIEEESDTEDSNLTLSSAAVTADDELETDVVFMTEQILILGRDNTTSPILISYDTHGSSHHLAGEGLDANLNWSESGESRAVTMSTVTGEVMTQLAVYKMQLLTLTGKVTVTALEGQWPNSQSEPQLESELADLHDITVPNEDQGRGEQLPRLILGCAEVLLHPKKIRTPEDIASRHPKLGIFRSVLTGNLLACGELRKTQQ